MSVSPFKSTGARLFMASILGFLAAMGPLCTDFYLPALPDMAEELGSAPDNSTGDELNSLIDDIRGESDD